MSTEATKLAEEVLAKGTSMDMADAANASFDLATALLEAEKREAERIDQSNAGFKALMDDSIAQREALRAELAAAEKYISEVERDRAYLNEQLTEAQKRIAELEAEREQLLNGDKGYNGNAHTNDPRS